MMLAGFFSMTVEREERVDNFCARNISLLARCKVFVRRARHIKTIWSLLLRSFEFELLDPFPEPDYDSLVVGPKPCRVRYRRRALQAQAA